MQFYDTKPHYAWNIVFYINDTLLNHKILIELCCNFCGTPQILSRHMSVPRHADWEPLLYPVTIFYVKTIIIWQDFPNNTFYSIFSCDSVDAVMVFITINGQKERVDNFCGNKLPAQLMSNGPTMTVEFRSHHSSPEVKGFKAKYRFVTGILWLTRYIF